MLTRITAHVYHVMKNRRPGPYNSSRHADNRKSFSGLSLTRNRREAHVLFVEGRGENMRCSC